MTYIDPLDRADLTEQELWEFLHYDEGLVGLTRRAIKYAVMRREIIPTKFGRNNFFSRRDGLGWVDSLKEREAAKAAQRQTV